MGCLVCAGPAEVHHVRTGFQPKDDRRVVGLCAGPQKLNAESFHPPGNSALVFVTHGVDLVGGADWNWTISVNEGIAK